MSDSTNLDLSPKRSPWSSIVLSIGLVLLCFASPMVLETLSRVVHSQQLRQGDILVVKNWISYALLIALWGVYTFYFVVQDNFSLLKGSGIKAFGRWVSRYLEYHGVTPWLRTRAVLKLLFYPVFCVWACSFLMVLFQSYVLIGDKIEIYDPSYGAAYGSNAGLMKRVYQYSDVQEILHIDSVSKTVWVRWRGMSLQTVDNINRILFKDNSTWQLSDFQGFVGLDRQLEKKIMLAVSKRSNKVISNYGVVDCDRKVFSILPRFGRNDVPHYSAEICQTSRGKIYNGTLPSSNSQ